MDEKKSSVPYPKSLDPKVFRISGCCQIWDYFIY